MKFHKQRNLNNDLGEGKGSCYPTVIACLLDKDLNEVPHFNLMYWNEREIKNINKALKKQYYSKKRIKKLGESICKEQYENKLNQYIDWSWYNTYESYLYSQGKKERRIKNIKNWLRYNKDVPYLVTGLSPRSKGKKELLHVVIYMNGELYHDPHPDNTGLKRIDYFDYLVNV